MHNLQLTPAVLKAYTVPGMLDSHTVLLIKHYSMLFFPTQTAHPPHRALSTLQLHSMHTDRHTCKQRHADIQIYRWTHTHTHTYTGMYFMHISCHHNMYLMNYHTFGLTTGSWGHHWVALIFAYVNHYSCRSCLCGSNYHCSSSSSNCSCSNSHL